MAFQLKTLHVALLGALGAGCALAAAPSVAQTTPERLERVEVTGSNIKRTDTETVAPVEVITREEIARSGRANIAEVLRNLPANVGSYNETSTNSFAPGASGISLRGLGQATTLVLLNGRRTSGYGFAQNLSDSFVDLNSIPTAAVERIEILKDGASAIYGSDAIAGVVNIILRKDYKGLEATIGGGRFEGKNDYQFNVTGGFGDLSADKYNVFATLDYYKRDLLLESDTHFGHTRDMRGQLGGRNNQSLTGGGTWQQYNGNTATTNFRAVSECPGTVLTGPQAIAAGLTTSATTGAASNTFCAIDYGSQFTVLPKTERYGVLSRGTFQFTPTVTGYLEVALNRAITDQTFQNTFFAGTTGLTSTPQGLRPFPYNVTFAPGSGGNPFPTNARYNGVLYDFGTRDSHIVSDTGRGVAGLNYTIAGWDFDSAVGIARNLVTNNYKNRLRLSGASAGLGITTAVQPPIPVSTASLYNVDRPSLNSQALRDSMSADFARKATSDLKFIDTKASTEFERFKLPGGPIGMAVGGEFRKENLKDRPDVLVTSGNILGQGSTATDGDRRSYAFSRNSRCPSSSNSRLRSRVVSTTTATTDRRRRRSSA